jgi:dTDP-4-amino-4,6-dideoxygalactose transaminase
VNLPVLSKFGGPKVRPESPPFRDAMGPSERQAVLDVLDYYKSSEVDPPYEGIFQKKFENEFAKLMGGGRARAVSSGSVSCFIAIRALRLPLGSEVIVPGVTDSGSIFAIVEAGLIPVIVDTKPDSYNTNWEEIEIAITSQTSAIFAVHMAGEPLEISVISKNATQRNLKLVEDCSQAPFARVCKLNCLCQPTLCEGVPVGSFGDVSAYSTMYRKSIHTGGSGGVVFTKDDDIAKAVIEESDRGRPKWSSEYRSGDPGHAEVSALNFNTDEFSCAIGLASLSRLEDTIQRRRVFLSDLKKRLKCVEPYFQLMDNSPGQSPFFIPLIVGNEFELRKIEIAELLKLEGISLLPVFNNIVADWDIAKKLNWKIEKSVNAKSMKARSFNLFLNENYGEREASEIVEALEKVLIYLKN